MLNKIKKRLENELRDYIRDCCQLYSLSNISPLLYRNIKEFIMRKGKRVRPTLCVLGYLGFAKRQAPGLFRSAISLELLHDFMLVHDDIIDKSQLRRGKPSMHARLAGYLKNHRQIKFNSQDLAIVAGDVIYAMSLHSFLAIRENPLRKEAALKRLIDAAMYTGSGEFIELLLGLKNISQIKKSDIYKIYDLKTAFYTFSSPLAIGACLAGAKNKEINILLKYGISLGRAFQIKDDIIGMFSSEKEIGKSTLSDLQEAKKTLLVWKAYQNAAKIEKGAIERILLKKNICRSDLLKIRKIVRQNGALEYAKKEINSSIETAYKYLCASKMHPRYKEILSGYSESLLNL